MAKRKIMIYLATAVLTIGILALCVIQRKADSAPFSIQISAENGTETIDLWEKERGEYYAFLPSYAGTANMTIRMNTDNAVLLNGEKLWEGMPCDTLAANVPHDLLYSTWGAETHSTVTFLYSANIATMYVDTQSGSMEYIHRKKGNEESGAMRLYLEDGTLDSGGELYSIKGRGNATWTKSEKKPYSITLSNELSLLGMGEAQNWILLANALEPSNIRNKLVYDFAKCVGLAYSPDAQWVDLYLNGEYVGLYLLCERNEVHTERVNISQNDSFLVSLELEDRLTKQNYPYVRTSTGKALRIHYPQEITEDVKSELLQYWQTLENAVLAEDGTDSYTGKKWLDIIDLDSWVRKCLVEEIFGNLDACFMSQYFYMDSSQGYKIYAGPVWDFDSAIGNEELWSLREPTILVANRLEVRPNNNSSWFNALFKQETFVKQLTEVYENDFIKQIEYLLSDRIYEYIDEIGNAHNMNRLRWQTQASDIQTECEEISTYLAERVAFLNEIWLEEVAFCTVKADQGFGTYYTYFTVRKNENLMCLPTIEDTPLQIFCGWYYKDTNEPFDPDRPITEDIEIYAKWQDKPGKKLNQLVKLVPLGVIGVIGLALLAVDIRRNRKRG